MTKIRALRTAVVLFALLCAAPLRAAGQKIDVNSPEFQRNRARWEAMNPDQKEKVRQNFERWKAMPETRRKEVRERWERTRPRIDRPAPEHPRNGIDRIGKPNRSARGMDRRERGRPEKPGRPEKMDRGHRSDKHRSHGKIK